MTGNVSFNLIDSKGDKKIYGSILSAKEMQNQLNVSYYIQKTYGDVGMQLMSFITNTIGMTGDRMSGAFIMLMTLGLYKTPRIEPEMEIVVNRKKLTPYIINFIFEATAKSVILSRNLVGNNVLTIPLKIEKLSNKTANLSPAKQSELKMNLNSYSSRHKPVFVNKRLRVNLYNNEPEDTYYSYSELRLKIIRFKKILDSGGRRSGLLQAFVNLMNMISDPNNQQSVSLKGQLIAVINGLAPNKNINTNKKILTGDENVIKFLKNFKSSNISAGSSINNINNSDNNNVNRTPNATNQNVLNIIKNSSNKSRTKFSQNKDICKSDMSEYPIRPLCMSLKIKLLKNILNDDEKLRQNFIKLKSINTREAKIIKRAFIHILNNMTSWRKSYSYTKEALVSLLREVDELNTSKPLNARNDDIFENARNDIFENLPNIIELPDNGNME